MIVTRRLALRLCALFVCPSILMTGCGSAAEGTVQEASVALYGYSTEGDVTAETSGDFSRLAYNGNYAVENNDWGVGQNGQGGSTSFIETNNTIGWAWNVYNGTNVVIYPEVGYGWSPNGNSSWGGNPTIPQLSANQTITSNFNIRGQYSQGGTWDMAYDIWITSAQHPANTVGSFELMIWLDHNQNGPWSTQGPQGVVNIDGVNYQRYTNAGAANWTCLTYINQGAGIYNGTSFNISDVIKDAAAKFGIPNSYYVSSIEFGNEAVNGSGMLEISNWAINIGNAPPPPPPPPANAANFQLNAWQYNQEQGLTVWNGGIGNFNAGNWLEFNAVNFSTGYDNYAIWYATTEPGTFDLRIDSPTGAKLCTVATSPTGGWADYVWGGCALDPSLANGVHNLYLVATSGASNLGTMWIKNQ